LDYVIEGIKFLHEAKNGIPEVADEKCDVVVAEPFKKYFVENH